MLMMLHLVLPLRRTRAHADGLADRSGTATGGLKSAIDALHRHTGIRLCNHTYIHTYTG